MRPFRVVMHAHSTWSYDGRWPLDRIARLYGALGVDAVMMTEHDTGFEPGRFEEYRTACAAASTRRCTLIPGIEYSSPDNDIHILTWGLSRFLAEHRPVQETLEAVREQGGVAVFAHPVRRAAWRLFEPSWVPLLSGIELWNRKSDGITWGREAWKLLQESGLPPTVGQDFHRLRQLYPLTMAFPPLAGVSVEQGLARSVSCGQAMPMVFGKEFIQEGKGPATRAHDRLDQIRRGILSRIRGK